MQNFDGVLEARVEISIPSDYPFFLPTQEATARVMVQTIDQFTSQQGEAIVIFVTRIINELDIDNIEVIDFDFNTIFPIRYAELQSPYRLATTLEEVRYILSLQDGTIPVTNVYVPEIINGQANGIIITEQTYHGDILANRPRDYIFIWPVPNYNRVASAFGTRTNPIAGMEEFHSGIDIPAPRGTDIVAAYDGIVAFSGWKDGFGNTVIIEHREGLSTLYAQNERNLVIIGDNVTRGQRIALIGSTGVSTGPHLHFEVRLNEVPIDPMFSIFTR